MEPYNSMKKRRRRKKTSSFDLVEIKTCSTVTVTVSYGSSFLPANIIQLIECSFYRLPSFNTIFLSFGSICWKFFFSVVALLIFAVFPLFLRTVGSEVFYIRK